MQRIRARDNIQPTVKLYVHAVIVLDILTIFYTGFHSPYCNYKIVFDMYRLCDLIRHVLGHNLSRNTEVLTNCHTISFRMMFYRERSASLCHHTVLQKHAKESAMTKKKT